jgi:hypothetical protein
VFWAQGVVVKPALAIPYFTGVAAFVGNILSLTNSIQKWQDAIVNKVLEDLNPVLDRMKSPIIGALESIIAQIEEAQGKVSDLTQNSHLSCISNFDMLEKVRVYLERLLASIETNNISSAASTVSEIKEDAASAVRAAQSARQAVSSASGGMIFEKGISAIKGKVGSEVSSFQANVKQSMENEVSSFQANVKQSMENEVSSFQANVKQSMESINISGVASGLSDMNKDAASAVRAAQNAKQVLGSVSAGMTFRKLNESEMILLLRSLWTSIR